MLGGSEHIQFDKYYIDIRLKNENKIFVRQESWTVETIVKQTCIRYRPHLTRGRITQVTQNIHSIELP